MADLWLRVDDRLKTGRTVTDLLRKIAYRCPLNRRWPWIDCVAMVPGLAVSARARETLEALRVPDMRFLEFRINREPFFLFYTERSIDCLDRSASQIELFSSSGRVKRVLRYAFVVDRLQACDVFTVPELSEGMFAWSQETFFTEPAWTAVERRNLVGICFAELPGR